MLALNELESQIQAMFLSFTEQYGVSILDVQLYDPKTCEIQLEVDI